MTPRKRFDRRVADTPDLRMANRRQQDRRTRRLNPAPPAPVQHTAKRITITGYEGNTDDDGTPLDLFSWLTNELDNAHIVCAIKEDDHELTQD